MQLRHLLAGEVPFWKSGSFLQDIIQEQPMETAHRNGLWAPLHDTRKYWCIFWHSDRILERKAGDGSVVGENTLMDQSAVNVRKQHIQDRIDNKILSEGTER